MTWPRLTLAHVPVFGAIACTMFFNGSYAYGQAGAHEHQVAMVALALTIDLAKATFLPAAAHFRTQGKLLGPLLLMLLWLPALAYSTFAGYAYLTTTRANAHLDDEAQSGNRTRAQADYDRATKDLTTAKTSADWTTTAACTRPRTTPLRSFCTRVAETEKKLTEASKIVGSIRPTHVNPEITILATVSGWTVPTLAFLVALFPAVLIELIAGLGLYVLRNPADAGPARPSGRDQEALAAPTQPIQPLTPKNPPSGLPDPLGDASQSFPRPTWKLPAKK